MNESQVSSQEQEFTLFRIQREICFKLLCNANSYDLSRWALSAALVVSMIIVSIRRERDKVWQRMWRQCRLHPCLLRFVMKRQSEQSYFGVLHFLHVLLLFRPLLRKSEAMRNTVWRIPCFTWGKKEKQAVKTLNGDTRISSVERVRHAMQEETRETKYQSSFSSSLSLPSLLLVSLSRLWCLLRYRSWSTSFVPALKVCETETHETEHKT